MAQRTVLIAGASGVIGEAALAHFVGSGDWKVVALSRRPPYPVSSVNYYHAQLDLTDPEACARAASDLAGVTHLVYAAVAEQPGLIAGWQDEAQMQLNLAMLRNLLEPLSTAATLRHVSLLQGAKAYGAHVGHPVPVPAREAAPRDPHANFYWLQEDLVRELSLKQGFAWTIFRPQVVIGAALGVVMNPLLPLAAYAAIRREEGRPFSYPGGELQLAELVGADLLAEAFEWAAGTERSHGETFNITNGDVFAWRDAWPALAAALGVATGPDEPLSLVEYFSDRAELWDTIVAREGLQPIALPDFLGQSHHYADLLLRRDATLIGRPTLLSTIKIRHAGFAACRDSVDSLRHWIRVLQDRRLIPDPRKR